MVLEEPSIREAVIGVPLYLHTNIVFAAVFLIKVLSRWKAARFEQQDDALTINLVERVVALLRSGKASERHLTFHIAKGLSVMLTKISSQSFPQGRRLPSSDTLVPSQSTANLSVGPQWPAMGFVHPVMSSPLDPYSIDEEYFPLDMFNLTTQMPG